MMGGRKWQKLFRGQQNTIGVVNNDQDTGELVGSAGGRSTAKTC